MIGSVVLILFKDKDWIKIMWNVLKMVEEVEMCIVKVMNKCNLL